jgi:cation diffusion facilitator family transporter
MLAAMHRRDHEHHRHHHRFGQDTLVAERRTRLVVAITAAMMLVEIVAGWLSNSMALLADGWHMGTHVAAFAITLYAYAYSRRHADDPRYSFGTGKVGVLGGFGSGVLLLVVAALMAIESLQRLLQPGAIHFDEALLVATIGLAVNLACALLFRDIGHGHAHAHDHDHGPHGHDHGGHDHAHLSAQGQDLNLRSAYLHVLADALTSVAAILALLGGKFLGWAWLDPVMGLAGSAVITTWALGLLRETSVILLDRTPGHSDLPEEIRKAVEGDGDSLVTDLHVWQVGAGQFAAIVGIAAHRPRSADDYRTRLAMHEELVHVSIEIGLCAGQAAGHEEERTA